MLNAVACLFVAMVFLSATCIGGFYATSLTWGQHTHYSMIEYWRWWLVHLWVEGFFEVFATAVVALIFTNLGLVQGKVGTGENQLQNAIQLAQSQISSFSGAQSAIRDADVAAEAANLSKAQVLAQSSVAALVQANAMPQAVLALLKG